MGKCNCKHAGEVIRYVLVSEDKRRAWGHVVRSDGVVLKRHGDGYKNRWRLNIPVEEFCERLRDGRAWRGQEVIIGATEPCFSTLRAWGTNGRAEAIDGCTVEPDGVCPHGYASWLVAKGLV